MAEKSYYDILELSEEDRNLNEKDFNDKLKKKYKSLARQWHPDRFSTKSEEERKNAEEKFKEIAEAYNTLSDPDKRKQYDFQTGGADFDPFGAGFNPWDIFGGGRQRQQTYQGQDINIEVVLTLEEAFAGGEKTVSYKKKKMCGHCNGTGSEDGKTHTCSHCNGSGMISEVRQQGNMRMVSSRPCPHCNGTGKTYSKPCPHCNGEGMKDDEYKETVTFPAGIVDGMYHTFSGKGGELPKGYNGIPGDLNVIFRVKQHPKFTVESQYINLKCTLDVDVVDLMLGCEKEIECIDGTTVKLKIPELTENNHIFIIKGKGMPVVGEKGHGNLRVVINAKMPKSLNNKQRKLLKDFKNS